MKKLFVMMMVAAVAVCAKADFLWWNVDDDAWTSSSYDTARLYQSADDKYDTGDTQLSGNRSAYPNNGGVPTTSTGVSSGYYYYILLGTYADSTFTAVAVSQILNYTDLASYIGSSQTTDSWNGTSADGTKGFTAVPEPTSGLLLCLGAALLALRRKRA